MGYATEQRKLLHTFLRAHPDQLFTAREIAQALPSDIISQSAVYRNLSELEKEGLVERSVRQGSRESYYRFGGAPCCQSTLHLICTNCGATFHMKTDSVRLVEQNVLQTDGFWLNKAKTVLFGLCKNCR